MIALKGLGMGKKARNTQPILCVRQRCIWELSLLGSKMESSIVYFETIVI